MTVTLPEGFELTQGTATQGVPPLPFGAASRTSPVTWKVRAPRKQDDYALKVQSSNGLAQTQKVTIKVRPLFGS